MTNDPWIVRRSLAHLKSIGLAWGIQSQIQNVIFIGRKLIRHKNGHMAAAEAAAEKSKVCVFSWMEIRAGKRSTFGTYV